MRRYKAIVGVLLAAIATFLVSCGGGPEAVAPTYTPEKVAQITNYVRRLESSRNRFPELLNYIEKDNWVNVDNFTHGPLGQLRAELLRLSGQLLPTDQPKAKALSEEILGHLQNLDEASQERNYGEALTQYREFVGDFEALLSIVPEGARQNAIDQAKEEVDVYEMSTTFPDEEIIRAEEEDMVRTPVMLDGDTERTMEALGGDAENLEDGE
ncbi:photosystem II protein PsbQ [cf. Phormidesmis sp. LEGE 11477]|uniref:photosystem II protein PsbQ n=1 Tax=cf. Phormidesmis sp. LEGE 11477 TaxID=1828680 RepID=UPI0018805B0D|nr:photosystem II protein PsbQ [cf. Phormidesmis sp. LEGE 11477]MBE9059635.1 photosystem II protein PsbQ [cf. Phormidesmis sp. LEGE 11477]